MKLTIDVDLDDYEDDENRNGAREFVNDILDRIASQILCEVGYGADAYDVQVKKAVDKIKNDVINQVKKEINMTEVARMVIKDLTTSITGKS